MEQELEAHNPETKKINIESDDSTGYSDSEDEKNRGHWSRKTDYLLSLLGYCVGLGNLWRFPYLCMRNGGGAFLIPFLFFLLTCGLPLYFLEVSLGQFTGKGALNVWEACPLLKGIGTGMIVFLVIVGLYYNIIIAWSLYYLGSSFISPLPWSICDGDWNSPGCLATRLKYSGSNVNYTTGNSSLYDSNMTVIEMFSNGTKTDYSVISSEEEFWQNKVLSISGGLHDIGSIPWHMALCFLAAWIIVYLCLIKGVKSVGKVVYVTALMPYILLTVILIRGLTLPGSLNGIIYYIKPNFWKLLRTQVWIEAGLQVFYSLGPTWGPLITMASYNHFDNNCYRDSIALTMAGEGTSIFGGFVVFSVLGFMAHKANLSVEDVVKSGPGLGFVAYPEAIAQLPLPNVWAVLFFFMLFTVGLDSQFAVVEVICTAITDSWPKTRKRRSLITAFVCALGFLIGLPMCTEGGMYIFQLVDWYCASFALPLFGLLECLIFGWIYGAEMFSRDIHIMLGRGVPVVIRLLWCIVTPVLLLTILVFTMVTYTPPTYGDYVYPGYARGIGWIIATLPLVPLPVYAFRAFRNASGETWTEKLQDSIQPSEKWMPNQQEKRNSYIKQDREYRCGMLGRIKLNILGHL